MHASSTCIAIAKEPFFREENGDVVAGASGISWPSSRWWLLYVPPYQVYDQASPHLTRVSAASTSHGIVDAMAMAKRRGF